MKATTVVVICDLCAWKDDAERMRPLGIYDACHWCAEQTPAREVNCGRHTVTIHSDDGKEWSCSCGATRASAFPSFYPWDSRVAVFPNIWHRLAFIHTESP